MELKACPCGKVPESIDVYHYRDKVLIIAANPLCCGWLLEVEDDNIPTNEAWNAAPRQDESR